MTKLTIHDLDLRGKRVFIRVDFNVPLKDGVVTDDTRIRETLPTLALAIEKGGRLVLASHLGRPKGKPDPKYSLKPVPKSSPNFSASRWRLPPIASALRPRPRARRSTDGDVLLLENVRYHPEEENNDEAFSRQLAALCDGIFVCDAFGSAHRAHASVVGITRFVEAVRGRPADGKRARLPRQGAHQSRSARSSPFWAAQKSPTKSKWSKT